MSSSVVLITGALTGIGRADLELRNTIVGSIVLPTAFLLGSQWGLNGLAFSWVGAIPAVFALNFPRTLHACGDL